MSPSGIFGKVAKAESLTTSPVDVGISPQSGSNEITGLAASARPLINMIKRPIAANRRRRPVPLPTGIF